MQSTPYLDEAASLVGIKQLDEAVTWQRERLKYSVRVARFVTMPFLGPATWHVHPARALYTTSRKKTWPFVLICIRHLHAAVLRLPTVKGAVEGPPINLPKAKVNLTDLNLKGGSEDEAQKVLCRADCIGGEAA